MKTYSNKLLKSKVILPASHLENNGSSKINMFMVKKVAQPYSLNRYSKLPKIERVNLQLNPKYFQSVIKNETILERVLSFLDIKSLGNVASLNSKLRMIVKHFIINYSLNNVEYSMNILKKNIAYSIFLPHINKKIKIQQIVHEITESELEMLQQDQFKKYLNILNLGLQSNGFNVSTSQTIMMIKKYGLENLLKDVFNFSNQKACYLGEDISIPDYTKSNKLSLPLNELLGIIAETILYKKIYHKNGFYQRNQNLFFKSLIREKFDNIKKIVQKTIQPLKFKKDKNVYQYLNKNNLSIILSFLNIKSIKNLKIASKKLSSLMNYSIENLIVRMNSKKEETMEKLGMSEQNLEKIIINLNYQLLSQIIIHQEQKKIVCSVLIKNIIKLLNDISQLYNNSPYNSNKEAIQSVLNLEENNYAQFLQSNHQEEHVRGILLIRSSKENSRLIRSYVHQIYLAIKNNFNKLNFFDDQVGVFGHQLYPITQAIAFYQRFISRDNALPQIYCYDLQAMFNTSEEDMDSSSEEELDIVDDYEELEIS